MIFVLAIILAVLSVASARDWPTGTLTDKWPTLPTQWVATTIDPPMGQGVESYNFVSTPTAQNPSTMWSNYTDCERLIYVPGYSGTRYLLGCDSLDCCWETQDGNQVEFQIPNIYYANPDKKVDVYYRRWNVSNFGNMIEADEWSWALTTPAGNVTEKFWAYTLPCESCVGGVQLMNWEVQALSTNKIVVQFQGYRGYDATTEEGKAFAQSFQIPKQCTANNLLQCPDDLHDKYFGKKVAKK